MPAPSPREEPVTSAVLPLRLNLFRIEDGIEEVREICPFAACLNGERQGFINHDKGREVSRVSWDGMPRNRARVELSQIKERFENLGLRSLCNSCS